MILVQKAPRFGDTLDGKIQEEEVWTERCPILAHSVGSGPLCCHVLLRTGVGTKHQAMVGCCYGDCLEAYFLLF